MANKDIRIRAKDNSGITDAIVDDMARQGFELVDVESGQGEHDLTGAQYISERLISKFSGLIQLATFALILWLIW